MYIKLLIIHIDADDFMFVHNGVPNLESVLKSDLEKTSKHYH